MGQLQFATDTNTAKRLSSLFRQDKLRKIYSGIYTNDLATDLHLIVMKNWMEIVPYIVPHGLLSFRTAHDLKPISYKFNQSMLFVTSTYVKTITLPGLTIKVLKGNVDQFKEQVLPKLARSNEARMLLENLAPVRGPFKKIKSVGQEGVEKYLAKELRLRQENRINAIRDAAKEVAQQLGMDTEYILLNQIVSGLLATHPDVDFLTTPYAKSVAKKEPFDAQRLSLFENLSIYLHQTSFIARSYDYQKNTFKNISFFESYFSNYIEGTKFIIDEAEQIVFTGKEIYNRHADSHDILANFRLNNDHLEMLKTPNSPSELLQILQDRHAYLMHERPDVRPGMFKEKANRAGNTIFVAPNDVVGTLTNAFAIYALLPEGIQRALFMQFLISEVHPFDDGNGRLARIMMNAELVKTQSYKIIIPTVYRDGYIQSLRLATRDQFFQTYCKVMDVAQAYTASIPWEDYFTARDKIEADRANLEPDEGIVTFNSVIRKLELSDIAR